MKTKIDEHRRFREQCRRRIRPAISLFLLALAGVVAWACFRPVNAWVAGGALVLTGGSAILEMASFRYHDRKLRELEGERPPE